MQPQNLKTGMIVTDRPFFACFKMIQEPKYWFVDLRQMKFRIVVQAYQCIRFSTYGVRDQIWPALLQPFQPKCHDERN